MSNDVDALAFSTCVIKACNRPLDQLDELCDSITAAMHDAHSKLPDLRSTPKKPWVSGQSLAYVDQRRVAREQGNHEEEQRLSKVIRKSIKDDKTAWLHEVCSTGSWHSAKILRKPPKPQQGRLRNLAGVLVSTDERSETLAEHLEKIQWAVRPCTVVEGLRPALWEGLPVTCGPVMDGEVQDAVCKLKNNKAGGADELLPEHFKALAKSPGGLQLITKLCQLCWESRRAPSSWMKSRVTLIFKKGDPSICDNYRPISLLSIGYKILASLLLKRLKDAGAEARIWGAQFGFKSGAGTADALFIARRIMEDTHAEKEASCIFLALDWAKAFDTISPSRLADALRSFGIPSHFIDLIGNIYDGRQFFVRDMQVDSGYHKQHFGISQGCPLSPFLFVILMTVLMHDARRELERTSGNVLASGGLVHDLLYADDTLLIDARGDVAQAYMEAVVVVGAQYGLKINWKKVEFMAIRCTPHLRDGNDQSIPQKSSIGYLGALLDSSGAIQSELNRRIGMATADFKAMSTIWNHSHLTKWWKHRVFQACISSKLLYGLQTAWLTKVQRAKVDGFQAKCIRKIIKVAPSYWSRVSNVEVLARLGAQKLSKQLLEQQLMLFGKIYRRSNSDISRQMVFDPSTDSLRIAGVARARGRPRLNWCQEVHKQAILLNGGSAVIGPLMVNEVSWKKAVRESCRV